MLILRPSLFVRVAYVALFVLVALMFAAGLKDLPPAGLHDYVIVLIALACLYAGATYPLRAVVFDGGAVRVRSLGGWSRFELPPRVRVARGLSFGSVYVLDDATGRVLLNLKREFGPIESVEARVKAWLRQHGRLAPNP